MAFHKWAEMFPNGEDIKGSFRALTHFIISLWDPVKPSMASHVNVHGRQWVGEGADWSSALELPRCLRHSLYIFMGSSKLLQTEWTKPPYMFWETARNVKRGGKKRIADICFCSVSHETQEGILGSYIIIYYTIHRHIISLLWSNFPDRKIKWNWTKIQKRVWVSFVFLRSRK